MQNSENMKITEFVKFVLESRTNEKQVFSLGKVSDQNAEMIKITALLDVKGYERIIDNYAVKHIKRKHGNQTDEAKQGQVAVNHEDFEYISDIVDNPDRIKNIGDSYQGGQMIQYEKRITYLYIYVEEKRDGKQELAAKTMYKRK